MTSYYNWQDEDLYLNCYLQPRAAKDEFVGSHDGYLKIRITAPPVDGKANKHLIKFVAKQFKVTSKQITLVRGETSRYKRLAIACPKQIPATLDISPHVS